MGLLNLLLLGAGLLYLYYTIELKYTDVDRVNSPDGRYSFEVQKAGRADTAPMDGTLHARVTPYDEEDIKERFHVYVFDDSTSFGKKNYKIFWEDEQMTITFVGSDQIPETYTIRLD